MIDSEARAVESDLPEVIAGRYRVRRVLGRGGMATVYLCEDLQASGLVAVKVLRQEIGSAVVVERFLREIEFASRLDHPRIPRVLDSGTTMDGTPFYVMTYIEGESLRELLDRVKQLPIDDTLAITAAVIEPMTYAHRMGIVHRDIKPGNIVIGVAGVHVLDFGIARAIVASADDRLTSTGIAIGTPAYMSPEQALGDEDLDARSDIYSLGCVIYEMIAGIPPFVGATPQAAMARRFAAAAPPLSETRDGVPQHIVHAVAKALNRAPADRWQTVRQFNDALSAPPSSGSVNSLESHLARKRRRFGRIAAVAVGLAVVASVAFTWSAGNRDYTRRGLAALQAWDFTSAERNLRAALARNPDDPHIQLWLGQTLVLRGAPPLEWQPFVLRAADAGNALPLPERERATALAALAEPSRSDGCGQLQRLVETTSDRSTDFSLALTYADCLAADQTVVEDAGQEFGYRFRSSHHRAASEYEALLVRNAADNAAYLALMPRLERVLVTSKNKLRGGLSRGSVAVQYIAWSTLAGDSLAQVPQPLPGDGRSINEADPDDQNRLILRNLQKLTSLATTWARKHPGSPDAHETLSGFLEATGKLDGGGTTALGEIRTARERLQKSSGGQADDYLQRVRLAAAEARLLIRLARFEEAARVARLAIDEPSGPATPDSALESGDYLKAALSALVGRQRQSLDLELRHGIDYRVRLPSGEIQNLPAEIAADAIRLENYASFGVPVDSILAARDRLSASLDALVAPVHRRDLRIAVLRKALSLAAPSLGPAPLAELGETPDLFSTAVRFLAAGNRLRAREFSDSLASLHASSAPGEVTMDAVLMEAWLRSSAGDTTGALKHIDGALAGLSRMPVNFFNSTALPASLVRVMILRSDLSGDTVSPAAGKWRAAASVLWAGGDPAVTALVRPRRGVEAAGKRGTTLLKEPT